MEFKIEHTWNNFPVSHDPVMIKLTPENAGILMEVSAPFFNDPTAPPGEPGKPFNGLWDYEVVEAFFLNDQTQQYLEVELCPDLRPGNDSPAGSHASRRRAVRGGSIPASARRDRMPAHSRLCPQLDQEAGSWKTGPGRKASSTSRHGQHLVLLLSGRRKICKQELPLKFEVSRTHAKWTGKAHLPWSYFPPSIDKFNAFAIHGSGVHRTYEALYPVCQNETGEEQKPDFHRLEYFKSFSLQLLMGEDWKQPGSDLWPLCK